MSDQATETMIRLQTRAIQDLARRVEQLAAELVAVRAATEKAAAVVEARQKQDEIHHQRGILGWADRNPWPAFALVLLLLLGLTGQLYLLPQIAPAIGGVRVAP